jgi:hypothetical protein
MATPQVRETKWGELSTLWRDQANKAARERGREVVYRAELRGYTGTRKRKAAAEERAERKKRA